MLAWVRWGEVEVVPPPEESHTIGARRLIDLPRPACCSVLLTTLDTPPSSLSSPPCSSSCSSPPSSGCSRAAGLRPAPLANSWMSTAVLSTPSWPELLEVTMRSAPLLAEPLLPDWANTKCSLTGTCGELTASANPSVLRARGSLGVLGTTPSSPASTSYPMAAPAKACAACRPCRAPVLLLGSLELSSTVAASSCTATSPSSSLVPTTTSSISSSTSSPCSASLPSSSSRTS